MRHTKKEINELLSSLNIPTEHFNYACYRRLMDDHGRSFMQYFTSFTTDANQTAIVKRYAAKFTALFDDYDLAIKYLDRLGPPCNVSWTGKIDGDKFPFPETDDWSPDLWRSLLEKHKPSAYSDLVIRLFRFADRIEEYVNHNHALLVKNVHDEVLSEYENLFRSRYRELTSHPEHTTDLALQKKEKIIKREVDLCMDAYLRRVMQLPPEGRLTPEQAALFKLRRINKTKEDDDKEAEIEVDIKNKYREKINRLDEIMRAQARDVSEADYVRSQLELSTRVISTIIADRSKHILSASTPLSVLAEYASHVCYASAEKNLAASRLFFKFQLNENAFNRYLALKPNNESTYIPDVKLNGSMFGVADRYTIQKLPADDPRAALLGHYTSCCQSMDDAGEAPTLHGIEDPRGGFYVLFDGNIIVAQCWAWRGLQDELVFDSIESQKDFRFRGDNEKIISRAFIKLANYLVEQCGVHRVLVGNSGETPDDLMVLKPLIPAHLKNYAGYTDAAEQYLLAETGLPLVDVLTKREAHWNADRQGLDSLMDDCVAKKWHDMCILNAKPELAPYFGSEEAYLSRIKLNMEWLDFLRRWKSDAALELTILTELQAFVARGINVNYKSPLYQAVENQWLDVVKYLVAQGANVNEEFLAYYALEEIPEKSSTRIPMLKCLAAAGLDFNSYPDEERSYLERAVFNNDTVLAKFLLKRGVSLRQKAHEFLLHEAVQRVEPKMVKLLLMHGAGTELRNQSGFTPLWLACSVGKIENALCLIEHGANSLVTGEHGENILHLCVELRGHVFHSASVDALIRRCPSLVNGTNHAGKTPLYYAFLSNNFLWARALIAGGASLDVVCVANCTIRQAMLASQEPEIRMLVVPPCEENKVSLANHHATLFAAPASVSPATRYTQDVPAYYRRRSFGCTIM